MSGVMLSGYFLSAIASLVLAGWLATHRAKPGSSVTAAALALTALWTISVLAEGASAIFAHLLFGAAGSQTAQEESNAKRALRLAHSTSPYGRRNRPSMTSICPARPYVCVAWRPKASSGLMDAIGRSS